MASLSTAIMNYLLDHEPITDVVGEEIYTDVIPESATFPALGITLSSLVRGYNLDGYNGRNEATIEVTSASKDSHDCHTLRKAIVNSLQGYKGGLDGLDIRVCTVDADGDVVTSPEDGSDNWFYSCRLGFRVVYFEEI